MEFRLVVFGVLYRETDSGIEIMTQTRNPHFHKPDPFDGGREECVAETVKTGEGMAQTLERAVQEETGVNDFVLLNLTDFVYSEDPVDVIGMPSICWTEAVLHRRALRGPTFLVEVGNDFQPVYKEGPMEEAIACRWWPLNELDRAFLEHRDTFVSYHRPSLAAAISFFKHR